MDSFFRETRDGRHVVALDIYPQLLVRTLDFLRCSPSTESINNAILKWDAVELEQAAAGEGLVRRPSSRRQQAIAREAPLPTMREERGDRDHVAAPVRQDDRPQAGVRRRFLSPPGEHPRR